MNPLLLPTSEPKNWVEQFTATIQTQRERAREFLAVHQARIEQAEEAIQRRFQQFEKESLRRTAVSDGPLEPGADEYQRRYKMALDDLRKLKITNAELQRNLAQARSLSEYLPGGESAQGGKLDWEAEKQRILAALESDFDQNDPPQQDERLKIEDVLQATEKVIAEKDREIEELRQRLEEHDSNAKIEAERSAAIDQVIDDDAEIRRERERLEQLQEQWRDKMRNAEVEWSVGRAKLARQNAELENRAKAGAAETPSDTSAAEKVEQSVGGRWLARLGLAESDWTYRKRR